MAIAGVNVTLDVPGMENRPNSMLINYRNEKGIMRNMFVYAESGQVLSTRPPQHTCSLAATESNILCA